MPTLDGLDYYSAGSGPAPNVTAAAGLTMVFRYVFGGSKGLTAGERDALHGAGLAIGLYYESHGGYLLEPDNARSYGQEAADQALGLGVPLSVPICHSLDVDTGPEQFPTVAKCMQRINQVRGRVEGFYGEADAIDYLWDRGLISFAVNTASVGWSGGRVSDHAAVWQYRNDTEWGGKNVDLLTIRNPTAVRVALWWPPGHAPTNDHPIESGEDDDMLIIYPVDNPNEAYLLAGGSASRIHSGVSITNLRKAGVKTAPLDRATLNDRIKGSK